MTQYVVQGTTLFTPKKGKRLRYKRQPGVSKGSYRPELMGLRFGMVKVVSPEAKMDARGYRVLLCQCQRCGIEKWINAGNLLGGKTGGCQHCNQPRLVPSWLEKRCQAAKQRCQNPKDRQYRNYGKRGIEFRFFSAMVMGLWVMKHLGLRREMEIDRINNGAHYEPGNLRYASRRLNCANKRGSVVLRFHLFRQKYPGVRYADSTLKRLLSQGLTSKQITRRYHQPSCKPKGKYGIFSTPDLGIVSQLKAGL